MGRIGRLLCRRLCDHQDLELVAVNDIMDPENLAYLLRYDSVYGTFEGPFSYRAGHLEMRGRSIAVLCQQDAAKLPWASMQVDIVLECSGQYATRSGASLHLEAGAKRVLLSTTGSLDIPLLIFGFNQHALATAGPVISPGGCMTNCATHILYLLNSIGIESAHLNILHSYTSRQGLVDGPHHNVRRGRAAAESIIPVEIDLAQSLERLLPALKDRIAAASTRVPVANGALADFTVQLKKKVSAQEINTLFRTSALHEYQRILAYNEDLLVSQDIKGNTHSCIVDGTLTSVVGNQVKLMAWFDNEYGYTTRMIDWLFYWK